MRRAAAIAAILPSGNSRGGGTGGGGHAHGLVRREAWSLARDH